ncbi:unnamed protein product, partial [Heterobilharzia americana]
YTIREIGLQILDEYDLFRKMKLDYFLMARIFSKPTAYAYLFVCARVCDYYLFYIVMRLGNYLHVHSVNF